MVASNSAYRQSNLAISVAVHIQLWKEIKYKFIEALQHIRFLSHENDDS
jgi:hypothetical protein